MAVNNPNQTVIVLEHDGTITNEELLELLTKAIHEGDPDDWASLQDIVLDVDFNK